MNDYFATIKQIVLSKGSKDAKIKKMIDDLKCTRYEANHFYQLVMHVEKGTKGEKSSERVARRSFTMGVEIECFGFRKSVVREALQRKGVLSIETGYDHNDQKKAYKLGHDGSIMGENSRKMSETVQAYFDTEKNEWRCFKMLNLAAIY